MVVLSVFFATLCVDIMWARYIQRVNDGHRLAAAAWAATLCLVGSYVVTQYVRDPRLALIAALGAFVGTYIGTRRKKPSL